jgi:phytoene dehydrogenase-like protein
MKGFLDIALNGFSISPANTIIDMAKMFIAKPRFLTYLPLFMKSYQEVMEHYFRDPRLLEMLGFMALFTGLPPDLAPGPMAMLPYSKHIGFYYSLGGMIAIPKALNRLGLSKGVKLKTNTRVQKIVVKNGRASGVVLADGTEISCRFVISNINAQTLYFDLIGREHLPGIVIKGLESLEPSHVASVLCLGIDYEPPLESHHTLITKSMDELNAYDHDVPTTRLFPVNQFGLISWTSHSDPSLAPEGCHTVSITLTNAPYRLPDTTYDDDRQRIIDGLIDYFSKSYIPGLKDHVVAARLARPLDYERNLLLPWGSTYCFKQDSGATTVFRPAARSKALKRLYLTGASTHPGGGVPSTIASGMIAADLIDKYER